MLILTRRAALGAVLAAPALTALAGGGALHVEDAWSRAALPNRPAAIYLTIRNTMAADDRLIGASSPVFERIELHRSSSEDGVMRMDRVEAEPVPAGEALALAPGALHLMAFGATGTPEPGETFPLTLDFESAGAVEVTVTVKPLSHGVTHGHGSGG